VFAVAALVVSMTATVASAAPRRRLPRLEIADMSNGGSGSRPA